MRNRFAFALGVLAFAPMISMATSADAGDVDPGYVERCGVDKPPTPRHECVACRAYYRTADRCENALPRFGYKKHCQTAGSSVWTEVWCRKAESSKPSLPASWKEKLADPKAELDADGQSPDLDASAPADAMADETASEPADSGAITTPPSAADAGETAPPGPPPTPKAGGGCAGCHAAGQRAPTTALGAALVALAALVVLRRRR